MSSEGIETGPKVTVVTQDFLGSMQDYSTDCCWNIWYFNSIVLSQQQGQREAHLIPQAMQTSPGEPELWWSHSS